MRRVLRDAPALLDLDVVAADGETLAGDITAASLALVDLAGNAVPGSPFTVTTGLDTDTDNAGALEVQVPATAFPRLDELAATWTVTRGASTEIHRDTVAVVGAFLYTARELRAEYADLADVNKFTPRALRRNRDQVHDLFADACYVEFVPAARRVHLPGGYNQVLDLNQLEVTALRSAAISFPPAGPAVVLTSDELAACTLYGDTGHVVRSVGWGGVQSQVDVVIEHGLPVVPGDIHRAAMIYAKATLVPSSANPRATSMSTDGGSVRLSTAGRDGRTGYPDVDAALARYGADSDWQ